jgi:hypothetical protein
LPVCLFQDLGWDDVSATKTLRWYNPKAASTDGDYASAANSQWVIDGLHPMLFATTHLTWL